MKIITAEKLTNTQTYTDNEHCFYSIKSDDKTSLQLKQLYERMTFFKPIMSQSSGFIKMEEDIKRILANTVKPEGLVRGKL